MNRRHLLWSVAVAAGIASARSAAADPVLYSSITGASTGLYTINGQPNPSSDPNESGGEGGGDDFNTGYQVIDITGLTFYGGQTDAAQANYGVKISFYNTNGVRVADIYPGSSETYGIGYHTLSAGDFNQNGTPYIQTTGAGYIVFEPYYQGVFNANTGMAIYPPIGTPQFFLGTGGVPTVGANNPTISVQTATPGPGVVSTGAYATAAGPTAQYGQFELTGTSLAINSTSPVWTAATGGNWNSSSSWTLGVPNSTSATANFFESITADSNVTLSTAETVGTLNLDNPLHRYTLVGPGTLTLSSNAGPAVLNGWGGSQIISCPVTFPAGLNVTAFPDPAPTSYSLTLPSTINATGTLNKSGTGTLGFSPSTGGIATLNLPALSIGAGTVALESSGTAANRTVLVTSALTLSGGRLDLGANAADLVAAGSSGLSTIVASVQQGYASGTWNGSAGVSSSAASADTNHLTAVGVVLNSTAGGAALYGSGTALGLFEGQNPGATDVLVKYTYYGDANLDGRVDGSDYTLIDNAFAANRTSPGSVTGWYHGDFNYDGVVDGSDYTLIDNAFNNQRAQIAASVAAVTSEAVVTSQVAGPSAVPEPTSLAVLAAVGTTLFGRRRRPILQPR